MLSAVLDMSMRVPPQDDPPSPPLHKEIILMYNAKFHFHSLSSTLEDILRVGGQGLAGHLVQYLAQNDIPTVSRFI